MFRCPSHASVDQTTFEWNGDHDDAALHDTHGLCPDFLHPPDNGCEDHYDNV